MIYYVTGIDPNKHDEWVISTHDTAEEAAREVIKLREEVDGKYEYRVDAVPTTTVQPYEKMRLSAEYGKAALIYGDTDSLHTPDEGTKEFTRDELFPDSDNREYYYLTCGECAGVVLHTFLDKHTAWHNKLLP